MAQLITKNLDKPYGKDSILIFHHINKCGGSTFRDFLNRNFDNSFHVENAVDWPNIIQQTNQSFGTTAISGPSVRGIHEHLLDRFNVYYVTILRNPVDLVRSHYQGSFNLRYHYGNLEKFILSIEPNQILRNIANGDLTLAKERLQQFYFLFGMVEYYDISMDLFSHYIPFHFNNYKARNVSNSSQQYIDQRLIDIIMELNRYDIEFYQWAYQEFKKLTTDYLIKNDKNDVITILPEKIDDMSSINSDKTILDSLKNDDITFAIERLENIAGNDFSLNFALSLLYAEINNKNKLETCLIKLDDMRKDAFKIKLSDFYRKSNPAKSKELLAYLIDTYKPFSTTFIDSDMNQFLARCYSCLADLCENLNAEINYRQALSLSPKYIITILNYAVFLRKTKQYDKLVRLFEETLERLPSSCFIPINFYREFFVSLFEAGEEKKAYKMLEAKYNSFSDIYLSTLKGFTPIPYALKSTKSSLIIRTAPMILLDYFITEKLNEYKKDFYILTTNASVSTVKEKYSVSSVFFMPDGIFDFDLEQMKVDPNLKKYQYDLAIILMNNLHFQSYIHIYKLIKSIHAKSVYFYSIEQMSSKSHNNHLIGEENIYPYIEGKKQDEASSI
ncbi:MAG: hypothetical protein HQK79_04285 [Desulfobacterales bacterium]|nr:hypothetical protein [Desulfobacterales bacterium]